MSLSILAFVLKRYEDLGYICLAKFMSGILGQRQAISKGCYFRHLYFFVKRL